MTASRAVRASGGAIASDAAPALDVPARFMAVGMLGLLILALLDPWALPLLIGGFYETRLLAFVHLNTLGVIAAVIVGASYQLVPVVVQTPLASDRVARVSFWFYVSGLLLFVPGLLTVSLPGLALGSTLLWVALSIYIGLLLITLRQAPRRDVVAWHIAAALAGLSGGVILGVLLAFSKATGVLGAETLRFLAAHVTLMLAGWVVVLLNGVAYRLVGMFTLSEDRLSTPAAWAGLALSAGGAWLLAAVLLLGVAAPLRVVGAAAILAGQLVFALQIARMYRGRRRRGFDVHIPFMVVAVTSAVLAASLVTGGMVTGARPEHALWIAAGWLAIAGVALTAIQGFFYKIATFLVWLHRYAPQAGRKRVPRLEDLYGRRLAVTGWGLWGAGLLLSVASIGLGSAPGMQLAGAGLAAGLTCFLVNVARIASHGMPRSGDG